MEGLVYAGKVVKEEPIEGADRIVLATVVCGQGGKWRGVVPKGMNQDNVLVFLPDSVLPSDNPDWDFMSQYKYRVRQRQFKGMPSECLIMPAKENYEVGTDLTEEYRVQKYEKPTGLGSGDAAGDFPSFIPRTDETLVQKVPWLLDALQGKPYQITMKMDGSSTTAYRWKGEFGVCSRNLKVKPGTNRYWAPAVKHGLEAVLPEGLAVQYETCGPAIQKNKAGLSEIEGFAFQTFDIEKGIYVSNHSEYMPNVPMVAAGECFAKTLDQLQELAALLKYPNGHAAEGIVVRSSDVEIVPMPGKPGVNVRLSFKVVNLLYKD